MRHFFFKTLTLIVFLIGITFQANAQSTNVTLVVTKTNGEERFFQLTEESQLYFENGERLVIEDGNGTTTTFQLSQVRKIVCSEVTGTPENPTTELQLYPNPSHNNFLVKNLQGSHPAQIYSLDGRLMKSFEATEGMVIDASELPEGMYLLQLNGQILKMMKL